MPSEPTAIAPRPKEHLQLPMRVILQRIELTADGANLVVSHKEDNTFVLPNFTTNIALRFQPYIGKEISIFLVADEADLD